MKRLLLATALIISSLTIMAKDIVWYGGHYPITYTIKDKCKLAVRTALDMFSSDMKDVTGRKAIQASPTNATIEITQLDMASNSTKKRLKSMNVPVDRIAMKLNASTSEQTITERLSSLVLTQGELPMEYLNFQEWREYRHGHGGQTQS